MIKWYTPHAYGLRTRVEHVHDDVCVCVCVKIQTEFKFKLIQRPSRLRPMCRLAYPHAIEIRRQRVADGV